MGEYSTVACASALFQVSPGRIRRALRELGTRPALTLNCLHYYRDRDIDAAIRWIRNGGSVDVAEQTAEASPDE